MTDQTLLGRADEVSRDMATDHSNVFGGKDVLLCGNWLQIPLVQGTPFFALRSNRDSEQKKNRDIHEQFTMMELKP